MTTKSSAAPLILDHQTDAIAKAAGGNICNVCGADVRPIPHVRWQDGAWCYDCVTIVRSGGRVTVQARF